MDNPIAKAVGLGSKSESANARSEDHSEDRSAVSFASVASDASGLAASEA